MRMMPHIVPVLPLFASQRGHKHTPETHTKHANIHNTNVQKSTRTTHTNSQPSNQLKKEQENNNNHTKHAKKKKIISKTHQKLRKHNSSPNSSRKIPPRRRGVRRKYTYSTRTHPIHHPHSVMTGLSALPCAS